MLVTFSKSDAAAEAFPAEADYLSVTTPAAVHITYGHMRTARDWPDAGLREGDAFAYMADDGYWITFDAIRGAIGPQSVNVRHWSDVVVEP